MLACIHAYKSLQFSIQSPSLGHRTPEFENRHKVLSHYSIWYSYFVLDTPAFDYDTRLLDNQSMHCLELHLKIEHCYNLIILKFLTGWVIFTPCSCGSTVHVLTSPCCLSNQNIAWVTGVGSSGAHTK